MALDDVDIKKIGELLDKRLSEFKNEIEESLENLRTDINEDISDFIIETLEPQHDEISTGVSEVRSNWIRWSAR